MAQYLKKPVFEIQDWPEEELDFWAAFFSIDDNGDKPIFNREVSVQESIAQFKLVTTRRR